MRLVIISNRLPLTVTKKDKGFRFTPSIGGLATGLKTLIDSGRLQDVEEVCWVGWPSQLPASVSEDEVREQLRNEFRYEPVFYSKKIYNSYYLGFCNNCIWPLFHSLPTLVEYEEEQWQQYLKANELYLKALSEIIREGDVIWIQDYHLMLLPQLIRQKFPHAAIGFFLHIPFPPFEIFSNLPRTWRIKLLTGMLGADLVGFHTNDYTQSFLKSAMKITGFENKNGTLLVGNRRVKVDNYPMGIDYKMYADAAASAQTLRKRDEFLAGMTGEKLILSVDRLDYTKGIINRLLAYEQFLENHREWHQRVSLILVLAPSRTEVKSYIRMKAEIDERVGKINGAFGVPNWTPILYQYKTKSLDELAVLYSSVDMALITPLRDGMNLIAKEFIACRPNQDGVLVLSELAGASQELIDAMIVNPFHLNEMAAAIYDGLTSSQEEQKEAMVKMQHQVKGYDVVRWAEDFILNLTTTRNVNEQILRQAFDSEASAVFNDAFVHSDKRLLLIDYDGTLVNFASFPEQASPTASVLDTIERLIEVPQTKVVLLSGRDRFTMEKWFGHLDVSFIAENGTWLKHNGSWKMMDSVTAEWKQQVLPMMKGYALRLPGSFVEEKEFSMVWHFRNSDVELSRTRSLELMNDMKDLLDEHSLEYSSEIKSIEIRKKGVNKGKAVRKLLAEGNYDFIGAFGDDHTDEVVFETLPFHAFSFKVGIEQTSAKFSLPEVNRVESILHWIIESALVTAP